MDKSELYTRLCETLQRVRIINLRVVQCYKNNFLNKLELLNKKERYSKLLKSLFSSNEINEFNSYVFEASFAYDFENAGRQLKYETQIISDNQTSIDFFYETQGKKIYFELAVINQEKALTSEINEQQKNHGAWQICQDGNDDKKVTIRIQNLILAKCKNDDGNPIKFTIESESYNFIVVDVFATHMQIIDKHDCNLAMYGDPGVGPVYRRDVFGLCQQLPNRHTDDHKKYFNRFSHFRNTIHGVFFVKEAIDGGGVNQFSDNWILQYYFLRNSNLLKREESDAIISDLVSFLPPWTDNQ